MEPEFAAPVADAPPIASEDCTGFTGQTPAAATQGILILSSPPDKDAIVAAGFVRSSTWKQPSISACVDT
jgi:hypothetical protein